MHLVHQSREWPLSDAVLLVELREIGGLVHLLSKVE